MTALFVTGTRVPGLGKLQGADIGYGMSGFFAVPYAKPPVGALRWQPPRELASWGAETRNATTFGKACIQGNTLGKPPPMDEDCLLLNIVTPTAALSSGTKLPVMLWIHGGGCERLSIHAVLSRVFPKQSCAATVSSDRLYIVRLLPPTHRQTRPVRATTTVEHASSPPRSSTSSLSRSTTG